VSRLRPKQEGRGEDAGSAGYFGGILMRWPWRRQARKVEPRQAVSTRIMELQTAKEFLVEVFHARPGEVEESGPAGGQPQMTFMAMIVSPR